MKIGHGGAWRVAFTAALALLLSASREISMARDEDSAAGPVTARAVLETRGDRFLLDGRPFDMWGIRVASATVDAAQTEHLIAQLDVYKAYGINALTVFYQGCSGASYEPFSADGLRVDAGHQERMEQIIRAAAARGMVVVVGLFYQNAPFGLRDAEAVRGAVRTVTRKLKPYRNLILNIANEQNSGNWNDTKGIYDFTDPARVVELCEVARKIDPERLVGGGGYDHDKNIVIGRSPAVDVLLFDTSGPRPASGELYDRFVAAGVTGKPVVNVETFGGWTKPYPKGIFPAEVRQAYLNEVDAAVARPGLSVFFHNNPWLQAKPMRYDLGGSGTDAAPGIRWYFETIKHRTLPSEKSP